MAAPTRSPGDVRPGVARDRVDARPRADRSGLLARTLAWPRHLDRLLTWKRARMYALVLVALYVVAWVDVLALGNPPLNSSGTVLVGDYIAFHAAGRLVLSGHSSQLYDHAAMSAVEDELLGGRIPNFYDAYRNPPFFALLFAPLALLGLLPAFAVFFVLSVACLALALWLLVQEAPSLRARWRGLVVLVLAFPPIYFGLIDGENAVLSLLLYALIYRSLARNHDRAAGVWAALGLFKPQLFFIFPLVFIASRRWRALAAYCLTAAALLTVSVAVVGPQGMQSWLRILVEPESGNASVNAWRMASLKSFFDQLLPDQHAISLALYAASAVAVVLALLRAWSLRQPPDLPALWALTSLVAVLVDPHLVDYDLTILVAAAVVAATPLLRQVRWWVVLLYVLTLFRAQVQLGDSALQLTVVVLGVVTVLAWRPVTLSRLSGRSSLEPTTSVPSTAS